MKMELRVQNSSLHSSEDGTMTVSGYVNRTDQLSNTLGVAKKFKEKIPKGVFSRAIQNAQHDIDFLAEHNNKLILASTRNNSLELREDEVGLYMSATITPTSWGHDYYELISSGILKNMSFGFRTVKDSWKSVGFNLYERTIEELELFEVSVVKDPAYSQSTISARGIDICFAEDIEIPVESKKGNKNMKEESINMEKTVHQYRDHSKEIDIEKDNEVKEFNNYFQKVTDTRSLNPSSGNQTLVPTAVSKRLVEKLEETSPVFARVKKFSSVNGDLRIPKETSVGVASFVGEGKSLLEEAFSLGEVTLTQKRAGAYIALTNQLINDSVLNMAEYIPNLLAKRTFKAIERSILRGTSDDEFAGIVPNPDIKNLELSTSATDYELLDKLLDMSLSIHPDYLKGSQFIMSRAFYNRVCKLKDAAGRFYLQNGEVNGHPSYLLFGLEVVVTNSLEDGSKTGEVPCIVGNLEAGYAVMIKKNPQMTLVRDSEHALHGSLGFLFDIYVDGAVYNPDALSKLTIV
ncbi:phage major capsid protein [Priestia megaterium]|uniref:Phage major capsid protein n=1 Tax=Priestia megaterium TaxID=1404 RepID=A0A6M6DU98_PRIMG|nr:phage major capsid protein [Priestia megaterium]QJX76986.1 phage major capsid protein [Priestia megaterium]